MMKKFTLLLVIFAALLLFGEAKINAQTCPPLIWQDEFNGATLSAANWNTSVGNGCPDLCGFGNNELQSYQAANLTVSGGTLKILAKQENINDRNYSSGKITSKDLAKFTYGRYEARIKLPKGDGLWPAFWMLSNNEPYGTWPKSGEIDIMEYVATNNDETLGYIHYGDFWPNNKNQGKKYKVSNTNLSDDFHVFAVEWEMNIIRWYIDGVLFSTKTNTDVAPSAWPFDQDMYMILNVAVGGNLGGAVTNSMLPATMEVDYVRVYGGNKPYLTGDNVVTNSAAGKIYTLSQVAASGTTINWSVPSGATIVSGQGTNSITVNFGSTNGIVSADYTDNCLTNYILSMPIKVEGASTKCATFENFDEAGTLTTNMLTTGALTEVANPLPMDPLNNSALVGKYIRKSTEQYDVLFYNLSSVANANDYKDGTKKFYMDIYTAAPVGSEIYLQLETAGSSPSNYPTGRHSRYIATVLENAKWHRVIFSLLDTPDAGASPLAITKMVILFKPNTTTGDTYYFDNLDSYCSAVIPPTLVKCDTFENFDEAGTLTTNMLTTGTLSEVANPLPMDPLNNSALVGKYIRNGAEQYDVLFYNLSSVANANDYKDGTKKFYMDIYTAAPVGSEIYLQLETAGSAPSNYPTGRHSRYIATVLENAKWHRVIFSLLDTPDAGASPLAITKMVILFKPNTNTGDTYYFDNLDSYCSGVVPPTMAKCSSFENFDDIATISEVFKTGVLTEVSNPLPSDPINSTVKVGKYDRAGGSQYDVLIYNVSTIANGNDYKNGVKKFYMDVYTQAPIGTEIIVQLETSAASGGYPTGRHSRYNAFITDNSKWKRLEFVYVDQPDPAANAADIKAMIVLFKPNSNTSDTYYFDNFDSYCVPEPPTLVKCGALENFDEVGAITYDAVTTGVLTEVANPSPSNPINTTALVGKYVRAASAAYDVLFYNGSFSDADDFKNGAKKFFMDVKTTAPVGTEIIIQLEIANAGAYPNGRHSRFHAFTTSNAAWQRLEFDYIDSPGGTVDPTTVTKMVILFMPGQNTGDTYYFDNLDTYCLSPVSSNVVSGTILEDPNGGAIDGTPLSVGGTYISIFKSSNTSSTPDATVPVASGTGAYAFPALPTGKYKLVYTTNPAGSTTPSFPNIGGFSMKAGAEGEAGTMGDGNPDGITYIEISVGSTIYSGAKVAAPAGVSFALAQDAALPVRLISFEGKSVENGNELNWKVSAEQNFSHYEIEKSIEAKLFKKIGTVNGTSNTNERLTYSFLDQFDAQNPIEKGNYYRLKMVDLDGQIAYSKVLYLENRVEISTVGNFYPNPMVGNETNILINSNKKANWTITAYDISGRLIKTENKFLEKGLNSLKIETPVGQFNFAIYRFDNGEEIQYRKLIK